MENEAGGYRTAKELFLFYVRP